MSGMDRRVSRNQDLVIWKHRLRVLQRKWTSALSMFIILCTILPLIIPAITLESETFCGFIEHTHSEACYTTTKELICGLEEGQEIEAEPIAHVHSDECYEIIPAEEEGGEEQKVLICGYEEGELIPQTTVHTHTDACYTETTTLTCTIPEHTHEEACLSNLQAGVETYNDWAALFYGVELTGNWAEDLVTVAKTQLGYHDVEKNFIINEDGTRSFYSRYGAWYGIPYGDWCAMFIAFCLNYAEISNDQMPWSAGCGRWAEALKGIGRYQEASSGYEAKAGDLVFFRYATSTSGLDHVGIVTSNENGTLKVIEGNYTHQVALNTYAVTDTTIMGYGVLPENPALIEQQQAAEETVEEQESAAEIEESSVTEIPAETVEESTVAETEVETPTETAEEPATAETETSTETVEESINTEEPKENAVEAPKTLVTDILCKSGETFRVSVTFGKDAMIPNDATLNVQEILVGTEKYDEYRTKAEESREDVQQISYIRLFDITILSGQNEVQPAAPVEVKFDLQDTQAEELTDGVQVIHFAGEEETPEVVEATMEDAAVTFNTDGFSVYAIVDAPPVATPTTRIVQDITELSTEGESFYLYYYYNGSRPTYFQNSINGNNAFVETTNLNSAAKWYFESASETDNTLYYIYTYVSENGSDKKKYIRNTSGNLVGLVDSGGTIFDISESQNNGRFYFKKQEEGKWLQHSNGGGGIRFWTDNNNAANSQICFEYVSSHSLPKDPYGLDGQSFGIAYQDSAVNAAALMTNPISVSNQNRLEGCDMLMRPDVSSSTPNYDGILLVAEDSDIVLWTFEAVKEDQYYLTTIIDNQKKYLTIQDKNVTLQDEPDEVYSVIKATPGTGNNAGKWHFTVNNYSLNLPGVANAGFNAEKGNGAKTWMNLVKKSEFQEEDFTLYTARKVSVSDTEQVNDKAKVIIYTRVWNEDAERYDFYAVNHDGALIPCYDTGDSILWIGNAVNYAEWEFSEGTDSAGNLSHYYWLRNVQYPTKYLTPNGTSNVIYETSQTEDFAASVNLNGRRDNEISTTIIAWDDDRYAYTGLKVENGRLVLCALSEADPFYFAIVEPTSQTPEEVPEPTPVATVDGNAYGITMKMVDFNNRLVRNRDSAQIAFFDEVSGIVRTGLLSTNLEEDGYPIATDMVGAGGASGQSLSTLFTGMTDVNHLFIESIYQESGYFEYDSTQNFAHLNRDGDFTVYDQIGAITGNGELKNTRTHGQFMPYDTISSEKGYAIASNGEIITNLTDVKGQELPDTNARKGEKLYKIGSTTEVDYFFGMEMEATFTQTVDGLDDWGHDIIFEFSGDDDFWLYVDGELVLDLGDVHSAQSGSVNFRTGIVTTDREIEIYGKGTQTSFTLREIFETNYRNRYPEKTDQEVTDYLNEIFDGPGTVFPHYTNHTMKIFYMERGAGASNLHMRFNLAAVKPGTFILSKTLSGSDSASNNLIEFPYQIYYNTEENPDDFQLLNEISGNQYNVLYEGTGAHVPFKASFTPAGGTEPPYQNVFFLKPGESAQVTLPKGAVNYYVKECAVNPDVYDHVKVNGTELSGTETNNKVGGSETKRKDYTTGSAPLKDRTKVEFDNHVADGVMNTLSITKKLYDSNGYDMLHYPDDATLFSFRLYLGNENSDSDNLPLANLYSYLVKDQNGNYCKWDMTLKKFVSLGIQQYDDLVTMFNDQHWTEAQKETVIFKTSMNGMISKIPADYTVEVRDLIVGTKWKVAEKESEIPRGYTLRLEDGYTRMDTTPEQKNGTTPISGTIQKNEDPAVEVRNQKGWGLTVDKVWTDKDFMEAHDPIYFAVYVRDTNSNQYSLVADSVRQLPTTEDSIYYFFGNLQSGIPFANYEVFEVTVEGEIAVGEDGNVTGYTSINRIEENSKLTIGGTPVGGTYTENGFEYTVSYDRGEQTVENANVRVDTVTNSRPGLKLFKEDWNGTPLAGAEFTLTGQGVYTSRASDGRITIAYLNPGTYTLTETKTPAGYIALPRPVSITIHEDNSVDVTDLDSSYYQLKQATETEMASLTIKNRTVDLVVTKKDGSSNSPMEGVKFALYDQVIGADGNPRMDYQPIEGFDNLVTNRDGILSAVNLTNLVWGNTYYLKETETLEGYDLLDNPICFTVGQKGIVSINSSDSNTSLRDSFDTVTGKVTYHMDILNNPTKKVSFQKVDIEDIEHPLAEAEFKLYLVQDEQEVDLFDGKVLTSDENGNLVLRDENDEAISVFELSIGTYHLVETKAPDGYNLKTAPVVIQVLAGTGSDAVTYDEGTSLSGSGNGKIYDETNHVYMLKISNSSGHQLPAAGGHGTTAFKILGSLMILGAAIALMIQKRKQKTE